MITWLGSPDRYHIEVLGDKGIYYQDPDDLRRILAAFRPLGGSFDAYSERFGPEPVMREFERVFLLPQPARVTVGR